MTTTIVPTVTWWDRMQEEAGEAYLGLGAPTEIPAALRVPRPARGRVAGEWRIVMLDLPRGRA